MLARSGQLAAPVIYGWTAMTRWNEGFHLPRWLSATAGLGHGPSSPSTETMVDNRSEDDIRRESEFLFRCYSYQTPTTARTGPFLPGQRDEELAGGGPAVTPGSSAATPAAIGSFRINPRNR